jgi:hypothetical protein
MSHPIGAIQIFTCSAIDSEALELIELFDLPPSLGNMRIVDGNDPMGHIQTFILEARGRAVKVIIATFEYDPNRDPMLRKID